MNTANQNTAPTNTGNAAENKQILLKDIGAKWNKFSEQELGALKNKDDLVAQVVTKYGTEKAQAQRDVDAVMKGRQI
jgi:division protein CdvB (Snf7/Vps24/ESCRT-III family)